MDLTSYLILVFVTLIAIFFLIEKPYKIGTIIVFMMLYQFNFPTPLPLDARGTLLLLLFIRLYLFDRDNMRFTNTYLFGNIFTILILVFTLSILAEPIINSKSVISQARNILLPIVGLIVGFILVRNEEGRKAVAFGIILAGIISSVDLLYTFILARYDSIDTIKLPDLLLGKLTFINHNQPGSLCAMALLYVYLAWYQIKKQKPLLLTLGLLLSFGVLISTSRSALLAILIIFPLTTFFEPSLRHNLKKFMRLGIVFALILIGFYFVYNTFLYKKASNYYIDKIYYRFYDEPLQVLGGEEAKFNQWTGTRVEGSVNFRSKRWQYDIIKFTTLDLTKQLFGLGEKGYSKIAKKIYWKDGNAWEKTAPHNGYLLILLERGILGLLLYIIIIVSLSFSAVKVSKLNNISYPFVYLLLLIMTYSFAQNSELTSTFTYLTFGCVIGNIAYSKILVHEEEEISP
jgi:O-antigen ligase